MGAISSGGTIDQGRIERICDGYYRPIAAYINSICPGYHDAQDLTQEFMAGLSRGLYVGKADPSAGRFRAFLCQCALNFARAEWRKRSAIKRGGDSPHIEFDDERCAAAVLPATEEFDRAWVEVVVERTLESLRGSFEKREKGRVVECLIEGSGGADRSGRPPS
ncbi:MAG: sigma-70 family RNA polymerase sigma factor [Verrucomicrobiales bacterium]